MERQSIDDIKRCGRCVLPLTLPSVKIDQDGICSHCKNFENVIKEWNRLKPEKENELSKIIQRIIKYNRKYDCLVPLSGGKDSTYALYIFSKLYNLKCLCVTFDNGFLSEHARSNIDTAIANTTADHIYYTINRNTLLKLYRLSLVKSGQSCSVCMRGIGASINLLAKSLEIPLLVTGGGAQVTYMGNFPEVFQDGNAAFFTKMVAGDSLEADARALMLFPRSLIERAIPKLFNIAKRFFRHPTSETLHIELYDYIAFSKKDIHDTIKREMGWRSPENHFEHMDCLLHEIQHYVNIFNSRN